MGGEMNCEEHDWKPTGYFLTEWVQIIRSNNIVIGREAVPTANVEACAACGLIRLSPDALRDTIEA